MMLSLCALVSPSAEWSSLLSSLFRLKGTPCAALRVCVCAHSRVGKERGKLHPRCAHQAPPMPACDKIKEKKAFATPSLPPEGRVTKGLSLYVLVPHLVSQVRTSVILGWCGGCHPLFTCVPGVEWAAISAQCWVVTKLTFCCVTLYKSLDFSELASSSNLPEVMILTAWGC